MPLSAAASPGCKQVFADNTRLAKVQRDTGQRERLGARYTNSLPTPESTSKCCTHDDVTIPPTAAAAALVTSQFHENLRRESESVQRRSQQSLFARTFFIRKHTQKKQRVELLYKYKV